MVADNLCKDNASERKESLLLFSRVPLILCKDKAYIWQCKEIIRQSCKEIS